MVAAHAAATVTQVDGTILPQINNNNECDGAGSDDLQTCFNNLEGVSPPAATAIDAIVDAAQAPEIFVPNTAMNVTFRDISEGAGYENSFGWYNVGDDVLTPAGRLANLHPILGCGVPMMASGNATTHAGNPAHYLQNAEPNANAALATASVNFAAERTAGRYKGGFIAFYLITPEDNEHGDGCGDFKEAADGDDMFGKIYFTQKDLNNDGDFVHHLVYRSKINSNRFYFGFEDLFRGGDNDFEDMLIQTVGLTPPCVPQPEICDGQDNDCDGLVDNADGDLTGIGNTCTCDGVGMTCTGGPKFGACRTGTTVCTAGAIACTSTVGPMAETCNNVDDNCNNVVDDNPSGTGAACDGPDSDSCPEGTMQCTNGGLSCSDNTGPNIEICNNIDDNCNGQVDEGNPGGGGSCGTGTGQCSPGTLMCQGGTLVCTGQTTGTAELCNNLDDNCNNVIDDNPTDDGTACGVTNVGQCELGTTVCIAGGLQCAGEVGPTPERCNMLDDDCDGRTDENVVDDGQPCGSGTGECSPGAEVCVMGVLMCQGNTGPVTETCDGQDDDCDGTVDEDSPMVGDSCGTGGTGSCSAGEIQCISGSLECVGGTSGGTETCNAVDDDCDGLIDEGSLCGVAGMCENGECASPCIPGEFPCPPGKQCVDEFCVDDPCFGVTCQADPDGNAQICVAGQCEPTCDSITCPGDTVCRGSDGACVPDRCEYLPKCTDAEICVDGACVANPCEGVTCPDDQFCREGGCVASCEGVQCQAGFNCVDGECQQNPCGRDCGTQVCDPETMQCVNSQCGAVQCPDSQVCDPLTGDCIADPCNGITCPTGQACSFGQCGDTTSGELITTGGGGGQGCSATDSSEPPYGALVALALVLLLRTAHRRKAIAQTAGVGMMIVALSAASCNVNEYCIGCAVSTDGDGGMGGDGGDSGDDGGPGDGGPIPCDPNLIQPESCNGADDDCDQLVDEGIDTQTDELNCGACGTQCNKPGAVTQCQAGGCVITGCFPGFSDADGDNTGPYADSNGCEYMCFTSNNGVEACDTLDNDCDSMVDEGIDVSSDVNNCGMCGRQCDFFEATSACVAGNCQFNPATDCTPGFIDANGMQVDGCEYQCTPTGAELCDVLDNDCDSRVDEGFVLATDPNNCGRCGNVCTFPNVNGERCNAGVCGFNAATDCAPGFFDVDGNPLNGCEYGCTRTNGGAEICDNIDNDCDGVADDNPAGVGGSCSSTGGPAVGACLQNGTFVCSGGVIVCSGATQATVETCNNVDQDCDGMVDDNVTQACYTGPANTSGIGRCRPGTETCSAGTFGSCAGQIVPAIESCNNLDDNCDGRIDNRDAAGNPITRTCYSGTAGTAGVGTCVSGSQTCSFGSFGTCAGEVVPRADVCGDNLDTDCDGNSDSVEGCLALAAEVRVDAGTNHSYDIVLARGGDPVGRNIYAAWSQLEGGATDVMIRKSSDGGLTWGTVINVTSTIDAPAVKPVLAVAPGATDTVVIAYQTVTDADERDIRVARSTNGGTSFTQGNGGAVLDAAGDSFHHAVAISGANIVVAWEKLDTTTLNRDIQTRVSNNSGTAWGTERKLNTSTGNRFAGRPQVAFAGTRIVWTWREQRLGSTRDIFGITAADSDAGTVPAGEIRIDAGGAAPGDTRDSDYPVMLANGANVYLVWQDTSTVAGGGSDVMFSRSTNNGVAWSTEAIIDDPAAEVSSSFTPALAIDGTTVAIAWEDRRQGTQVFVRASTNSGASFAPAVRATSTTTAGVTGPIAGTTTLPVIAAAGNNTLVVAYQNQLTGQRPHVYTASSIDNGATWTINQTLLDGGAGPAIQPVIAASRPGTDFAATIGWTDFRVAPNVNGDVYTRVNR